MFLDFLCDRQIHKVKQFEAVLSGMTRENVRALPEQVRSDILLDRALRQDLPRSQHYFLEVDQVDELRDLELDEAAFPRLPHELTFVEFDGSLHYDYDHVLTTVESGPLTKFAHAVQPGGSNYRGVLLRHIPGGNCEIGHEIIKRGDGTVEDGAFVGKKIDADVINAVWFTREGYVFIITIEASDWPKANFARKIRSFTDDLPEWADREKEHTRRLYHATVNLCHFLMSENVTFVKIKPEHRQVFGVELREFPKSRKPYSICAFQAPRYRYLQKQLHPKGEPGRTVSVRFDVRGHFRHLRAERYERDAAGDVRTTWVQAHQRGLGAEIYRPKLRVGHIGSRLLDYDEFVRELESNGRKNP